MLAFTYFYYSSGFITGVYVFSPRVSLSEYSLLFNVGTQIFVIIGIFLFYPAAGLFTSILRNKFLLGIQIFAVIALISTTFTISNVTIAKYLFCFFNSVSYFYISFCLYSVSCLLPYHQRGKSIGIAYSVSIIFTLFLGLLPGNAGLTPPFALFIYSFCIAASFFLYSRLANEKYPEKKRGSLEIEQRYTGNKVLLLALLSFTLLISILYGVSSQIIASYAYKGMNVAISRGFAAVGFILAGFLADRNRKLSFLISITALSFAFLGLLLYSSPDTAFFAASFTYLITGFYVLYPLVVFTDFAANTQPALFAAFGALSLRLGTIISYLMTNRFILQSPVMDILIVSGLFVLLLLSAVYLYERLYPKTEILERIVEVKSQEYVSPIDIESAKEKYGLTAREKDVLSLILTGITANDTAQKLYITERTVKAHLSSIYRKTGTKNRVELSMIISEKDIPAAALENKD
jgi:DNA-binding CsgD family transcriptional regulator